MGCNFDLSDIDFHGYATKNDVVCADGRIIRHDAFAENDGTEVPLVWGHQHNSITNILGHAYLENRPDGVYAYGKFNNTANGLAAKEAVQNGDIKAMSIFARGIKQIGMDVVHGDIVEVSLVTVGANPKAVIDTVLSHGDDLSEEGTIFFAEPISHSAIESSDNIQHASKTIGDILKTLNDEQMNAVIAILAHALDPDNDVNDDESSEGDNVKHEFDFTDFFAEPISHFAIEDSDDIEHSDKTVRDVLNTLTDEQMTAVSALLAHALDLDNDVKHEFDFTEEDITMHNIFDQSNDALELDNTISHADVGEVVGDMKRYGSLKESVLAHGITNLDYLFPDAKTISNTPEFIQRDTGWVQKVMSAVHHTPFSRIKSVFANITEDEARAKGYMKGKLKKEEVFSLLKRTTDPQTVYKKQKFDRDDIIDITSIDVISWVKTEMRMMLDEELARAYLIGDGRLSSSDDKIQESHIRPIALDDDLYTIKKTVSKTDTAKAFITAVIKSRKDYKGSGQPSLYTTEDMLTDMLLIEDGIGRSLYTDETALCRKLRVKEIITVPVMEGAKGKNGGQLLGVIVNLSDYNVGADKGGAINMFDDFDIDYNQQKYLIETRCSGALTKPYSAIALELEGDASSSDEPSSP